MSGFLEPVLVRAQNVHDYFVENHGLHGWENLGTFFAVRPAFPRLVVTYDHLFRPERVLSHVDVLVAARDRAYFNHYFQREAFVLERDYDVLRRTVDAAAPDAFVEVQLGVDGRLLPGRWFVMIDAHGKVLLSDGVGWVFVKDPDEDHKINQLSRISGVDVQELLQNIFGTHGAIALATLQFMNCKNVEVLEHPPTRQLRRAAERAGRQPPVTYKTLVIHPVGRPRLVTRHANGEPTFSLPLHICRGHFKDYTDGGGLGKHHLHGVWWWSPQVRGTAAEGRVVKDYEVTA